MMRLDDREWKPVSISNLFTFVRGRENNMAILEDGDTPLISARSVNNGLKGFVNTPKKIIAGNCITLNNDGDGGAGLAYYQPADMALDTHVTALVPKVEMSMYTMLFISECLSKLHGFFGHGLSISNPRAQKIRILLPVTDEGEPDYQFMDEYMSELMVAKRKQYRAYIENRLKSLGLDIANEGRYSEELKSRVWQSFIIKDIADVYSGHDIYAQERIEGNTPLVTAVGVNNGIGYFVGNDNDSRAEGSISVVRNGASVGKAFYHRYSALYGNDCRRMKLKNTDSEYASLFITQVIRLQNKAFSYSRKLGTGRLENLKIMLPVTDAGQPDYDFMESFGRKMMSNKYNQYLAFLAMSDTIKA